jgi:hypothetical protein
MMEGVSTIIPQQILQLRQIFGINTTLPNSISLLSSERIFYVAGFHGILFNTKEKEKPQSYFPGVEGSKNISSITVSGNKKLMAMGFEAPEHACICYYELNASPKRRKLELPDSFSFTSWISISFAPSTEAKRLAALTNKNDKGEAYLVIWNPERSKYETHLTLPPEANFHQVQFNPSSESSTASLLGERGLRFYELKENPDDKVATVVLEEIEETPDHNLNKDNCTLRSHFYLAASQHIVILADSQTFLTDFHGRVVSCLPVVA